MTIEWIPEAQSLGLDQKSDFDMEAYMRDVMFMRIPLGEKESSVKASESR